MTLLIFTIMRCRLYSKYCSPVILLAFSSASIHAHSPVYKVFPGKPGIRKKTFHNSKQGITDHSTKYFTQPVVP